MFDTPAKLIFGLITGIVFGFILQRARVARFSVIIGQLLLRDFTVVKVMGTAVIVGSAGVYGLIQADLASLHIKPALLGGVVLGGLLFGSGLAILGYCPGTTVAACGEGNRDAMVGLFGMFAGAILFVGTFQYLNPIIQSLGDYGKVTLPELTHTSPWLWIVFLSILAMVGFWWAEHRHSLSLKTEQHHPTH